MEKKKPWLNEDGSLMCTSTLKKVSKSWSARTWEEYLKTLERSRTESLMDSFQMFKKIAKKIELPDYSLEEGQDISKFKDEIENAFETFSKLEAQVIKMIFWEDCSERTIAEKLNLSRRSIRTIRVRALAKLRLYFQSNF